MAKAAKTVDVEVTEKMAKKFVGDIMERFERIESARGTYMNAARREREAMVTIYEGMAARGVSQKSAKTEIKIVRAMEKIKSWIADLEAEDRKMVQRLAKAQGDKKQLLLFDELPAATKPERATKAKAEPEAKPDNVVHLADTQPQGAA